MSRLLIATSLAVALGDIHEIVMHKDCAPEGTDLKMKWNMYSSEWGMYEIEGCEGVSPTLHLKAGETYRFIQEDISNWYHPVGFAYIAGGAHTECKQSDGTVDECPELGGEEGGSLLQYYINGEPKTEDDSGFGLDEYEPEFFNSQEWWLEQGTYHVDVTIPSDIGFTKLYYFCHIHAFMSAEINVIGSTSETTIISAHHLGGETEDSALAIYANIVAHEQKQPSHFDRECGTWNSAVWGKDPGGLCTDKHFVCGAGAESAYGKCLDAIDCQMHYKMAVSIPSESTSKFATFARQMIPHHQNAVAMSKILSKHMEMGDFGDNEEDYEWAEGMIRNIINVQNHQIQELQAWLAGYEEKTAFCYVEKCEEYCAGQSSRHHLLFATSTEGAPDGCPPCTDEGMVQLAAIR